MDGKQKQGHDRDRENKAVWNINLARLIITLNTDALGNTSYRQ